MLFPETKKVSTLTFFSGRVNLAKKKLQCFIKNNITKEGQIILNERHKNY